MQTDTDTTAPPDGLRAVADPLRWRILALLGREELCVCHLVDALDAPQSLISHHLRVLRDAGLVESERYRYWTYYRLRPRAVEELGQQLIGLAGGAPTPGTTRRACC
ncbi:MAG TPA: metalloregulator ArsR/SmtB family transcription factor [Acidimicrobiia bacterium]|nr:metalloregulator ArsR/SmtB family transcription factor [Acidimicrobiia bacterium]